MSDYDDDYDEASDPYEDEDVDEVGAVDGVGPSQLPVVAVEDEGRAREQAAHHVPALLALEVGLVPGHRALPGLVGVDDETGEAVGAAPRGHGDGVDIKAYQAILLFKCLLLQKWFCPG